MGTQWLDLTRWIANRGVADLYTVHPVRHAPTGPVETYADAGAVERVDRTMATEDNRARAPALRGRHARPVTISQVSAGRKRHLPFELDGSEGALAWSSERHEIMLGEAIARSAREERWIEVER